MLTLLLILGVKGAYQPAVWGGNNTLAVYQNEKYRNPSNSGSAAFIKLENLATDKRIVLVGN